MKLRFFLFLIICLIGIDFGTKYLAGINLSTSSYIPLLGDFFWLKLAYNRGVAFSLPIHGFLLQVLTLGLVWALIFYYFHIERPKKSLLLDMAYAFILAGALPHLYERLFVGHVVDFLSVKYFAILNFADIFISVWAFFILIFYFQYERSRRL